MNVNLIKVNSTGKEDKSGATMVKAAVNLDAKAQILK